MRDAFKVFAGQHKWSRQQHQHIAEIFYPQPFDHTPHLTIELSKKFSGPRGRAGVDVGEPSWPEYELLEQRPDGFVIRVKSFHYYEPLFKWKATGLVRPPKGHS